MAESPSVREGTKVTESEATKDPEQLLRLTKEHEGTAEVEGQARFAAIVRCPGCGTRYRATLSTRVYRYYSCPACGTYFKA